MEALAGWLKGDLPEIGRGGRHAAVNAVIDGGLVSVLHVYDLVIIAESKKLYPSKQKALSIAHVVQNLHLECVKCS